MNYSNISNESNPIYTLLSRYDLSNNDFLFAIIGFVFAIIGILLTIVIYKHETAKTRKKDEVEKKKENLKKLITTPNPDFKYSDFYKFLNKYHEKDMKTDEEYRMVDIHYFKDNLSDIELTQDEKLYKFPILFKKKWLRSYNRDLKIELNETLLDTCENGSLFAEGDELTKYFNISNYFNFLKNDCRKTIYNGKTFDLCKIEEEKNTLELTFCKGDYERFVKTYDLLHKELLYNFVHNSKKYFLRNKMKFDDIANFSERPAKIGLVVFTIMNRGNGGYSTFIHERKNNQVENPRLKGVVPSGAFQPQGDANNEAQFKFGYTIFREFMEEMFNIEEADQKYKQADPMQIFSLPTSHAGDPIANTPIYPGKLLLEFNDEIEPNLDKFENDKYTLIPTGFMIDITSFKPELTFLLYIKDENFYKTAKGYFEGCWEGDIHDYDIINFKDSVLKTLNNGSFSPPAVVSIIEGYKWFLENIISKNDKVETDTTAMPIYQ